MKKFIFVLAALMCVLACNPVDPLPETPEEPETSVTPETPEDPENPDDPENPETPEDPEDPENPENPEEPEIPEETDPEADLLQNFPIDFSMVGYKLGAENIPEYPVVMTLTPPAGGSDATSLIQNAINRMTTRGAILLTSGTYNVSGALQFVKSNVVLRGMGESTVIKATGTTKRSLLTFGKSTVRKDGVASAILDEFIPVGQSWVTVASPSSFQVGSRVNVVAAMNQQWISDLKMDQITQNTTNTAEQWNVSDYVFNWERFVVKVEGNKVWLDIPLVMELDAKYLTEVKLQNITWDRTTGSGIENLMIDTEYNINNPEDENHAWTAIEIRAAEDCWVKGVKSAHFGCCTVEMKRGCRNVTVKDCVCTEPISKITGSRRYAFHINGGQLCLIENCVADKDRHGFVFAARTAGPNVFLDCKMTNSYADVGPHQRWSTGALYDNCTTDGLLGVYDRAGYGTGHGWTGVSFVFWNCTARTIACQSPWVSGKNWCIGCVGQKVDGRSYDDGLVRPDGDWISHGSPVYPTSLYRYQLEKRKSSAR